MVRGQSSPFSAELAPAGQNTKEDGLVIDDVAQKLLPIYVSNAKKIIIAIVHKM